MKKIQIFFCKFYFLFYYLACNESTEPLSDENKITKPIYHNYQINDNGVKVCISFEEDNNLLSHRMLKDHVKQNYQEVFEGPCPKDEASFICLRETNKVDQSNPSDLKILMKIYFPKAKDKKIYEMKENCKETNNGKIIDI